MVLFVMKFAFIQSHGSATTILDANTFQRLHYCGFTMHTTGIRTEWGNVNVTSNQSEFIAMAIGILLYFMKYLLQWILLDMFFVFPLSRIHVHGIH